MVNKKILFVYGTLKDPMVQKKVFGRYAKGIPDILPGYKRLKIIIGGKKYSAVTSDTKRSVDGLVMAVTQNELKLIDEYETAVYKRIFIRLRSGKSAWSYVRR